jgi:hypothetical protein
MLFGLFALAALVIDFGFVRLTQRQMLSATDAAAMEGLRWRDVQRWEQLPPGWLNNPNFLQLVGVNSAASLVDPINPTQQDSIRRWAAANVVSLLMPSANSTAADPAIYGVGPELQFTATTSGGAAAGPLLTPGQPPVYQPQLQYNSGNAKGGDIVAGTYGPDQSAVEQSDYTRNDYSPTSAANPPPSMLVRMRRVAPGNPLDQQPGVSSSGDAVPFLFAYGAPIDRASIAQGVTVRGTAIASVGFNPADSPQISSSDPYFADYPTIGMVNSAGWADPTSGRIGVVTIAIYADPAAGNDQWSPLVTAQAAVNLVVASDGRTLRTSTGQTVGFLVNQAPWVITQGQNTSLGPVVLGQQVTATATALPTNQSSAYVLLVSAANQVIGFGATYGLSSGNQSITLLPTQNRVAWENASAMLIQPLPAGVNIRSLWTLRAAVKYPLFSPVLVNR